MFYTILLETCKKAKPVKAWRNNLHNHLNLTEWASSPVVNWPPDSMQSKHEPHGRHAGIRISRGQENLCLKIVVSEKLR